MVEERTEIPEYYKVGKDIWIRARMNALANKIVAQRLELISAIVFVLEMLLVIIPIICIGISLYYFQDISSTASPQPSGLFGLSYKAMGVISISSNMLALFLNILSSRFQWSERSKQHRSLMSGYAIIAQKTRRL